MHWCRNLGMCWASGSLSRRSRERFTLLAETVSQTGNQNRIVEITDLEGGEEDSPFRNVQASRQRLTDIVA